MRFRLAERRPDAGVLRVEGHEVTLLAESAARVPAEIEDYLAGRIPYFDYSKYELWGFQ